MPAPTHYLKAVRQYDPWAVINLCTLAQASGDAGALVVLQGSGVVLTRTDQERSALTAQAGVYSQRYSVPHKVRLSTVGDDKRNILGVMLDNVREYDYLGRQLLYDETRAVEANAVVSGQAVRILTRGIIAISGVSGTAAVNKGAIAGVGSAGVDNGGWQAVTTHSGGSIGKFLGDVDGNGFALFKLEL